MPGGYHANMKAWEPEEDDIINEMLAAKGPRWKIISKALPGRTVRCLQEFACVCCPSPFFSRARVPFLFSPYPRRNLPFAIVGSVFRRAARCGRMGQP